MRIDESHRPWARASAIFLAVAVAAWVPYALTYPGGARGSTVPGLIYGVLGYAMMLFAGLKGVRNKFPARRIGRAQTWMRGHLWMGLLSLPMILLHSSFRGGGALTFVLMILLSFAVASGVTGAFIQHFLPRMTMTAVPLETIFEEIPHVRETLREEAHAIVEALCAEPVHLALAASPDKGSAVFAVGDDEPERPELSDSDRSNLRAVYTGDILPFLRDPERRDQALGDSVKAKAFFEALRKQSSVALRPGLGDLESICDEERQLTRQKRLYYWMHAWLLVHVPVSVTLLVLGAIHALVAVHY